MQFFFLGFVLIYLFLDFIFGIQKPEGCFRAAFEDKVLMSDIVFLRAWYPVKPKKFYNPVTSLLLKGGEGWKGMRTVGQIRRDGGMKVPRNKDSEYKVNCFVFLSSFGKFFSVFGARGT